MLKHGDFFEHGRELSFSLGSPDVLQQQLIHQDTTTQRREVQLARSRRSLVVVVPLGPAGKAVEPVTVVSAAARMIAHQLRRLGVLDLPETVVRLAERGGRATPPAVVAAPTAHVSSDRVKVHPWERERQRGGDGEIGRAHV